jgi:hypothetical protein
MGCRVAGGFVWRTDLGADPGDYDDAAIDLGIEDDPLEDGHDGHGDVGVCCRKKLVFS